MRNRWDKMMNAITSREAYLIYGLVCGVTIAVVVGRMKPAQIYVISNDLVNEIRAKRAAAGLV